MTNDTLPTKVVKFITYDEAQGKEENGFGGMGGWFGVDRSVDLDKTLSDEEQRKKRWSAGHRWKDYVESYKPEAHAALEALRSAILEHKIRCTGEQAQNGYECIPLWDNGKVDTYSWRAWGDLMAAVWSTEDDKDYTYMEFYM